jgi:hypothetical protein
MEAKHTLLQYFSAWVDFLRNLQINSSILQLHFFQALLTAKFVVLCSWEETPSCLGKAFARECARLSTVLSHPTTAQ